MRTIPLSRGLEAIVDEADFDWLSQWKWSAHHNSARDGSGHYAKRRAVVDGKATYVLMHREIAGAGSGEDVDHINSNKLDNRRDNLRKCEHRQNCANRGPQRNNTSGFKGVFLNSKTGRWYARCVHKGVTHRLGTYSTKALAAIAYNMAALRLHGEFARLNDVIDGVKPREVCDAAPRSTSSKHRGVAWDKRCGRWRAYAFSGGRMVKHAFFATEDAAAEARRFWASEVA